MIDYNLQILSVPENLNLVEKMIDEIREKHNIQSECYGNMLVALTEAVNNAIHHGNAADPGKKVHIACKCENEVLHFYVTDEGIGFDYYNLPDPTAPENIEKPTGRGIFLMKHLSDQLIFSDNGRTIEMHFKNNLSVS
jgi:serine/threonine-protein kinase RsbW